MNALEKSLRSCANCAESKNDCTTSVTCPANDLRNWEEDPVLREARVDAEIARLQEERDSLRGLVAALRQLFVDAQHDLVMSDRLWCTDKIPANTATFFQLKHKSLSGIAETLASEDAGKVEADVIAAAVACINLCPDWACERCMAYTGMECSGVDLREAVGQLGV